MIEFGPSKKPMWNDGPALENLMGVEDAPPVATRHLCYGGGGGGGTPQAPDYSQYIKAMSDVGNTMTGYGKDLYGWATDKGKELSALADKVSQRAGGLADDAIAQGRELIGNWKKLYTPLFQSQVDDATRMNKNLPQTEEQYAGKYEADTAMAIDAAKASSRRSLQAQGLRTPGIGTTAIDAGAAVQRGAALAAAGETGRGAARTEARNVTQSAIASGQAMAGMGTTESNLGLQAGQAEFGTPAAAITTTAGAFSPSLGYYQGGFPYLGQWGSTMSNSYNQQLAAYNAQQNSGGGTGAILGSLVGAAGTVAGAYLGGPAGAAAGGALGKGVQTATANVAAGGMIPEMAHGGAPAGPHYVHPSASPSRGAITDDVPARLNAGEFVFPKDVVAWRGEAWMQKEIQKARQERQKKEVAKPEIKPAGAIHTTPPRFRSEGAMA